MAATVLGSLLVSLGLESAEFDRGLERAKGNLRRSRGQFEKDFGAMQSAGVKMGASLKGLGIAAVSTAFGFFLGQLKTAAEGSLEFAGGLGEAAAQVGVTTDALQEYRFAATQVGISQEEMDKSLAKLTRTIGQAVNGSKEQVNAFKQLGISIKDANGNVLNASDAIPKIADALAKVENPAQRAAMLTTLFGKAGQKLEPLLSGGSAAVNELRAAAYKLGVVLSADSIAKADETADKLSALNVVLKAKIASAVTENADAILTLANAFVQLVDWIGKATREYKRWKIESEIRRNDTIQNGWDSWFIPQSTKEKAKQDNARLKQELAAMDAKPAPANMGPTAAPDAQANNSLVGGGGASRSKKDTANEKARKQAQFSSELEKLNNDLLQAEADYTGSIKQEYDAKLAALRSEVKEFNARVKLDEDLTASQKAALISAKAGLAAQEELNLEQQYNRDLQNKKFDLLTAEIQLGIQDAQIKVDMAVTASQRRDAELELLDLQDRLKLAELDRILAVEATASAAWQNAKIERDKLIATANTRKDQVKNRNLSSGESYAKSIADTANNLGDAIDNIKVDGLKRLEEGLADAIVNFKSLGDVAKSVVTQVIGELLRLQIQQAIIKPLAKALKIPGFATGTRFAPGGLAIVGERGPELVNLPRGSQVVPNHELGSFSGGARVQVVPSPYFDVVVNGHIQRAAPSIAGLGAAEAATRANRSSSRRIG